MNKISTTTVKIMCTLTSWHRQFYKGFSHSIFADRPEVFAIKVLFNILSSWYYVTFVILSYFSQESDGGDAWIPPPASAYK
jgi:hypothetical protein